MKYLAFIFIISLSLFFLVNGCDSPSGSKPETVTLPTILTPADNATNVSITPTFTWSGSADVLEIAVNLNFSPVFRTVTVSGQSYTLPQSLKLNSNTRYYWRAGKKSNAGTDWSNDKFTFVTVQ
jgi:hypothetical protein